MSVKHLIVGTGIVFAAYLLVSALTVLDKYDQSGSRYVGRDCRELPAVEALQCQGVNDLCKMHRLGASNAARAVQDKSLAEVLKACERVAPTKT